jgi:hypothetical protein
LSLNTFASAYIGEGARITDCQYNWKDPTDDVLAAMADIMFRTAVRVANDTNLLPNPTENNFLTNRKLEGFAIGSQNVFKTHYPFLAAAAAVMALGILAVLPTFHGFWRPGRPVTFLPLEVAKAFDAPLLSWIDAPAGNGEAEALVKLIGGKRVRYRINWSKRRRNGYEIGRLNLCLVGGVWEL